MTLTKLREIAMAASQEIYCEVANTNARNNYEYIATFSPAMALKLLDCVEALEFYAAGHNPNEDYSKHRDGEVIPKMTKLKHTDSEGRDWIPLPVFCTHGLRMGHLARQALAALKETK